ncbi:DUF4145 domain-containing protein [Virgibacillus salexigens]|uniref:DUF4145 domain-containing protein n=1 Tax=Virgibacillus massiliensis TaxID=1462526 RepID=A0A024Q8R7_9BACI|nr:DUF4145 domain-containing protein [Virgibacillus massiliensis]CDQ38913.1 hypothetical protein BN990_01190 [Virgibacillus massiliensis]
MAVNYHEEDAIELIHKDNNPITNYNYLSFLPDKCPVCSYSLSPEYLLIYHKNHFTTELLCGCPREVCRSLFFAVYEGTNNPIFSRFYPYSKVEKDFPEEVIELSPDFVEIYSQAYHSEQEGLDMICGVGYRKALEHLIKDFTIQQYPDDADKIEKMPLQQCIQKYIEQSDIKDMAERAVWLGNDETHYVRKWGDKDIKDLKNLIDLTVYYLSMTLKARQYREEMVR